MTRPTTRRKITLRGQDELVAILQPYIQQHQAHRPDLIEARELRRALATIFGGDAKDSGPVRLEIVSVGQSQGARVKRL